MHYQRSSTCGPRPDQLSVPLPFACMRAAGGGARLAFTLPPGPGYLGALGSAGGALLPMNDLSVPFTSYLRTW